MNRRAIFAAVLAFICAGCSGNPPPPPPPPSSDVAAKPLAPSRPSVIPSVERPNTASRKPQAPSAVISDERPSQAAESSGTPNPSPSRNESLPPRATGTSVAGPAAAGNFIVSVFVDHAGNTWVGTEDHGVLRCDKNGKWTQFTTQDGLGDDFVYSINCDRRGRIWAGHLHNGVSVYNGQSWKNFGVIDGPIGERVFDIACNPLDGDIWIATSAGLSRYSESITDTKSSPSGIGKWSYVSRIDGLPSDQVNVIAFGSNGDLFAGTQCSGLAISRPDSNYTKWQVVTGDQSEAKSRQGQGTGIPSPLINDILVGHDGFVYVATVLGIAKSKNQGATWDYVRGRDFVDKVKGRLESPPKNWVAPAKEKLAQFLPEDYVTCLAEDDGGRLWVGFRQKGFLVIDPKSGTTFHGSEDVLGVKEPFVSVILPRNDGLSWIGGYGSGITVLKTPVPVPPAFEKAAVTTDANANVSTAFPQSAAELTAEDLQSIQKSHQTNQEPLKTPSAVFWGDDWQTRGNWVGRLGRQHTLLCAMNAPLNDALISDFRYRVRGGVGPNGGAFGPQKEKRELLRHWVHRRRWDDPRVLYNPVIGYRRQADWDDHGETYPMTHEGPDVWVSVEVPEGIHRLSLYFFNKDGHSGANRFRDYFIEIKEGAADPLHAGNCPKGRGRPVLCGEWPPRFHAYPLVTKITF